MQILSCWIASTLEMAGQRMALGRQSSKRDKNRSWLRRLDGEIRSEQDDKQTTILAVSPFSSHRYCTQSSPLIWMNRDARCINNEPGTSELRSGDTSTLRVTNVTGINRVHIKLTTNRFINSFR